MPVIQTIAAGTAILSGLKSLFGNGGSEVDPELVQLQKEIGQALLSQFKSDNTLNNQFKIPLSDQLKKRTGQKLPLQGLNLSARKSPLNNVLQRQAVNKPTIPQPPVSGGFNVDGSTATPQQAQKPLGSFLGGRTQRGGNPLQQLLIQAMQQPQGTEQPQGQRPVIGKPALPQT